MSLTFAKSWIVNGTAMNPDGGVTIGIYDDTAGLQVVAAGTAMTNMSPGEYRYTLTTALPQHAYTATIVVSFAGQTYSFTQAALPPPSEACPPQSAEGLGGPHDLGRAIAENAASAESVQSAAGTVKSHPLESQIKADQYLASKRAAQRGRSGLRILRREGNPSG